MRQGTLWSREYIHVPHAYAHHQSSFTDFARTRIAAYSAETRSFVWHGFRAQPDGEVEILGFFVDAMDQWSSLSRKRDFADVSYHIREENTRERAGKCMS